MEALATIAIIIVVWSAVSGALDRRGITSAIFFTLTGILVSTWVLGLIDVSLESETAKHVTELALVLLLFSDASRLDSGNGARGAGVAASAPPHRTPADHARRRGRGTAGVSQHGGRLCLPARDDAGLHRRGARSEGGDGSVRSPPACARRWMWKADSTTVSRAPFFLVALDVANADLTTGCDVGSDKERGRADRRGLVARFGGWLARRSPLPHGRAPRLAEGEWRQILPWPRHLVAYAVAAGLGGSVFIAASWQAWSSGAVPTRPAPPPCSRRSLAAFWPR